MSIVLENVSYTYMPGTPYCREALRDINLIIEPGEFIGIIGHTGSGKSTLVQHLNGLLRPTTGVVKVDGNDLQAKASEKKRVRQRVGMVFQYPEHQLFEETIFDDVAFGPRNLGLEADEVAQRVESALERVGLPVSEYGSRSPFRLSGGQMRRVAIAGVIALQPEYLVLDEPSAGLDPRGRDEIFEQIMQLYHGTGMAVVLVTHNMEDVARMAKRLLVMNRGQIEFDGRPTDLFHDTKIQLHEFGLSLPYMTSLLRTLRSRGLDVDDALLEASDVAASIQSALQKKRIPQC
ncbi:MAG TPA: energy-coupling factor transporter ATPase [Negativicutes bacterium]|nr:energy-coupling factor transporter ATPase [Negativicutes bacterium]